MTDSIKRFFRLSAFISIALLVSVLSSCSDNNDEPDVENITAALTQYKWVSRTSDEPLVDDDYQWIILDDYVTTLYFVSDYECVVRYYRKHYDSDDGTSYTRESQTVKYSVQGNVIVLENSEYTESQFVFSGDCLETSNSVYLRESIDASDREWLNDNYNHISSPEEIEGYSSVLQVIKSHVEATSSYRNFMWSFHVESSLQTVYAEADIDYGVGHGDIDGTGNISMTTDRHIPYTEFTGSMKGGKRVLDIVVPFWSYYAFGVPSSGQSKDAWADCELYYQSYISLAEKSYLYDSEKQLMNDLAGYLREYESDADRYYRPSIYVRYKNKYYKVATFKRM